MDGADYSLGMGPTPASQPESRRDRRPDAWSRYRDNPARHLIGLSRDLESRVVRPLSEDLGYGGLRPSFGPFLTLVWGGGRPLTAVAEELAVSKQACSQLANLTEAAGYVERIPHPEDRRSKVLRLTERGRALVVQGVELILESEAVYRALVGVESYGHFTNGLADLYEGLDLPTHVVPELTVRARQSVGVLPLIGIRIQRTLMETTMARGHAGLKMSHGQVLPLIGPGGGRIAEIARIQRVSRQAISTISQDLESLGYLRRESDARDGRSVVLRLTPSGEGLIEDSVSALDDLEREFRKILGKPRLEHLRRVARELYHALHLEAEIFEAGSVRALVSAQRDGSDSISGDDEIHELASRIRRQLGSGDTARLAALLEPRTKRTAT